MSKIYTAFISSEFESLRDERKEVIDCLLDHRVLPICMEHFTATSSGQFKDIQKLIDDSDLFILLLGGRYGSCDENGISWTQREYDYACAQNKVIISVICDELVEARKQRYDTLSEDVKKQIDFSEKVWFARAVEDRRSLSNIVDQAIVYSLPKCNGWVKAEGILSEEALSEWQKAHKAFDLSGKWYHMHLSETDEQYIRVGTITIAQDFTPAKYQQLRFSGVSYDIMRYNEETNALTLNQMKRTQFEGDYKLDENGTIFGIFLATRSFGSGTFNSQTISNGVRRGIHDFKIDTYGNTAVEEFQGEFHDEAPSPKTGVIFVYRSEERRNEALKAYRWEVLKSKQGGTL